jgi:hypothetical protein
MGVLIEIVATIFMECIVNAVLSRMSEKEQ